MSSLGPLMFDLVGVALNDAERSLLAHPATAGVILFTRNYTDPAQLSTLIGDIRAVRPEALIAVDQEGGRVQRLRDGFTRLPPCAAFGCLYHAQPAAAVALAETAGWLMAAELRAFDIDFSFAPVLDVDCGVSSVIGDRAFSDDPSAVIALAGAFARGMGRAGMAAVGKHFPGHGGVAADSHLELPVDARAWVELEQRDLAPFRALVTDGLQGIMPAHVVYPALDQAPAGFSSYWIRDILRGRMKFCGTVFSDDLGMAGAAIAGSLSQRAAAALAAGCDILLLCQQLSARGPLLDALSAMGWSATDHRPSMRGKFPIDAGELRASVAWREAVGATKPMLGQQE